MFFCQLSADTGNCQIDKLRLSSGEGRLLSDEYKITQERNLIIDRVLELFIEQVNVSYWLTQNLSGKINYSYL